MTPAQITTLRAACFADPGAAAFFVAPGNADGLKAYLNSASTAEVWRTDAPVDAILDAIDSTRYTPTATIAGNETEPSLSRKRGWMDEVNVKMMVLQNLLLARDTINAARQNVRASLRDAVIALPTGALDANGKAALVSAAGAGGINVLNACVRTATRAELMLAAPSQASDTTGPKTARVATFQGDVDDIVARTLIYKDDGSIWTAQG